MQQLGLALSGGGFRAALYHLGVVRFLRDAGILSQTSHITSVSGGSVIGAHLALNWDRYCGTDEEFQQVADELVQFLQLDVRNRIVRRFPLASVANFGRRTLRLGTRRQYTRAGLLEQHYERFLYGDTGLFRLPERPRLYILSTNLSEGSVCAFYRDGMLMQRRAPGGKYRFERVSTGLATVPMAVAASSAFPGFFPPLELRSWEVGAREGELSRQAFTDGGIYDNLGLRMFRHIEQASLRDSGAPQPDDVIDCDALTSTLLGASEFPENTPLRRLWEKLVGLCSDIGQAQGSSCEKLRTQIFLRGIGTVMRKDELYYDPVFDDIRLSNPKASELLQEVRASATRPVLSDQTWLNRQIISAVLHEAAGKPVLRFGCGGFDGILVSDAGAKFKVRAESKAGGLLQTAMRSSDILMDRVNQLEKESFEGTPGLLFFPITKIVKQSRDPYAPHPEVQRHAAQVRTDMDRFSSLEISALVQHGYCVARSICRDKAPQLSEACPDGPAWNPLGSRSSGKTTPLNDEHSALQSARQLQRSSSRRIVRTLLSARDWPTYVWVPLVTILLLTLPYLFYKSRKTAKQRGYVLSAIAETSPLYRKILDLIEAGPVESLPPVEFDEVESMEPPDFTGFEVLSDRRVFDFRNWTTGAPARQAAPHVHSRIRIRRLPDAAEHDHIRLQGVTADDQLALICRTESVKPRYSRMRLPDGSSQWEINLDFSRLPLGDDMEVVIEGMMISEASEQFSDRGEFLFTIPADTALLNIWMLMPYGRDYEHIEVSGYPIGQPDLAKTIVPTSTVALPIGSIATFQLINPKHNYQYICRWRWSESQP